MDPRGYLPGGLQSLKLDLPAALCAAFPHLSFMELNQTPKFPIFCKLAVFNPFVMAAFERS